MSDNEDGQHFRISRGKNWCQGETQVFVTVLENNFVRLFQKKRKAAVFESMSRQLRNNYRIIRSAKEVQNKYKSLIAEYRNELLSNSKQGGSSDGEKFKWFDRIDAIMRTHQQVISTGDDYDKSKAQHSNGSTNLLSDEETQFIGDPVKKLPKTNKRKYRDPLGGVQDDFKSKTIEELASIQSSMSELKHYLERVNNNLSNMSSLLNELVHGKTVQTIHVCHQPYKQQQVNSINLTPQQGAHQQYHQQCYSEYLARQDLQSHSVERANERNWMNL